MQQHVHPAPHSGPLPDRPPRRSSHPLPQAVHPVQQERMQHQQGLQPEVLGSKGGSSGDLGGAEGGAGKPVLCEAYPFSDPEMGALEKAGGLGMLGHRFYRRTTVNWCGSGVGIPSVESQAVAVSPSAGTSSAFRCCLPCSSIARQHTPRSSKLIANDLHG